MQQLVQLTGIAWLASEGVSLAVKRRVEYRSLPTRKWLNRCHSKRVPFHWTINPYRGCEYGCKYCYARFTHEFLERQDEDAFEREIYAKDWNLEEFRAELRHVKAGQVIGLGTATDPYQPAERKFGSTRKVLEAMLGLEHLTLFITTKSDLVARDAALLKEISKTNNVRVTSTVTTMDSDLARLIEPFAPRPALRIDSVAELTAAGVPVGVIASPVLPLITDTMENLEAVAIAAKKAGADQFGANVLFLKPSAQRVFFPLLSDKFPQHLARYRRNYAAGAYLNDTYPKFIQERIQAIRARVTIPRRNLNETYTLKRPSAQMLLF